MLRSLCQVVFVIGLLSLSGCGKSNDAIAEEMIANFNEMSTALEAGDKDKLQAVVKKMKSLAEQTKGRKDTAAESKRMEEKYKEKMQAAMMRLIAAAGKAKTSGKFTQQDLLDIQSSMTGTAK